MASSSFMATMRLVFIEGEGHYEPPFSCPNKETKVGVTLYRVQGCQRTCFVFSCLGTMASHKRGMFYVMVWWTWRKESKKKKGFKLKGRTISHLQKHRGKKWCTVKQRRFLLFFLFF